MKIKHRALLLRFLGLLLPLLALVVVVNQVDKSNEKRRLLAEDRHLVEVLRSSVNVKLSGLISNVEVLRHSAEISDYLQSSSDTALQRLQRRFLTFSAATGRYDQIRYIDESGMERVRVNFNDGEPTMVPEQKLQNKAGRYYFSNTFQLQEGEIFVSQFDLNVEKGRIELPWKPMIRIGTPVVDANGRKRGVLIFNYLGARLLRELDRGKESGRGHLMLLNDRGYWLYGPEKEQAWAFMFNRDQRFSTDFPAPWAQIAARETGQFNAAEGAYSFATIKPPAISNGNGGGERSHVDRWWKIVMYMPKRELTRDADERLQLVLMTSPVVLIIIFLVSWEWARITEEAVRGRRKIKELSRVVEQSEEIIVITDKEGNICYVNPAFERITGYSSGEALGRNPRILKSGKMSDDYYRDMWRTILSGRTCEYFMALPQNLWVESR